MWLCFDLFFFKKVFVLFCFGFDVVEDYGWDDYDRVVVEDMVGCSFVDGDFGGFLVMF